IIYNQPRNEFVANFVGNTNIFSGNILKDKNNYYFSTEDFKFLIEKPDKHIQSSEQKIVLRPERIKINLDSSIKGIVNKTLYHGNFTRYFIKIKEIEILIDEFNVDNSIRFKKGDSVGVTFPKSPHYI